MSKAKKWAVADCETDSFDGQAVAPFVWGLLDSEGERRVFWDTAEFVEYIRNSDIKYLYAHNGGKFDWLQPGFLENLEDGKIMLINSRLAKAKIGNTELRDSWLCLPAPLAAFGQKDDFDYSILDRKKATNRKSHKAAIEKYLIQDCVALFNAMERFISVHGFALTQAGAAMKTWEAMGGEKRRYGKAHDAIFRAYFYGGRTQVFEYAVGLEGEFQLFDINSSYPYAMTQVHPCGTDYYISKNYKDAPGASFWNIKAISKGAFPKKIKGVGTTFPVDSAPQEYTVTGWEVHAALDTGTAEIIEARGLIPRRFENMRPYVQKFYEDKQRAEETGDVVGRQIAKIFMNSCYGKFATNPDEYKEYRIVPGGRIAEGWDLYKEVGEYDILQTEAQNKQYFDVAMGASITGLARANLWRAICASDGVMYCDTDSVLCRRFGGVVGNRLGDWKHEADIKRVWIAGKKTYALELQNGKWKTAHKGVSKMDVTVQDIIRAAEGEIVEIAKSAPCMGLDGKQRFFSRRIRKT